MPIKYFSVCFIFYIVHYLCSNWIYQCIKHIVSTEVVGLFSSLSDVFSMLLLSVAGRWFLGVLWFIHQ